MLKIIVSFITFFGFIINPLLADGHKKIKVGMITTLSGGGSGLGIDVRDGFLLAVKGDKHFQVIVKDGDDVPVLSEFVLVVDPINDRPFFTPIKDSDITMIEDEEY